MVAVVVTTVLLLVIAVVPSLKILALFGKLYFMSCFASVATVDCVKVSSFATKDLVVLAVVDVIEASLHVNEQGHIFGNSDDVATLTLLAPKIKVKVDSKKHCKLFIIQSLLGCKQ